MPATSDASCRVFPKKNITVYLESDAAASPFVTGHVKAAWEQWDASTNLTMSRSYNQSTADIRVSLGTLSPYGVTLWFCPPNQPYKQSRVVLDKYKFGLLAIGGANARARMVATHELGHALGLDENTTTTSQSCGSGLPNKPTTIMYPAMIGIGLTGLCNHTVPQQDDINAINVLYK